MEKLYKREDYLNKIRGFYNDTMIKVITGIRRSGKSYLLKTIIEELNSLITFANLFATSFNLIEFLLDNLIVNKL